MPHKAGLAKVMEFVQGSAEGRPAKPEQRASVLAFLASDDASNVNGAILTADNGWFAARCSSLTRKESQSFRVNRRARFIAAFADLSAGPRKST